MAIKHKDYCDILKKAVPDCSCIMYKFLGKDNYGKPKVEYLDMLEKLDDQKLLEEAKSKIWLSAYADNNPRSDYHWQADAIGDEAERRGKPDIYKTAYDYNFRNR